MGMENVCHSVGTKGDHFLWISLWKSWTILLFYREQKSICSRVYLGHGMALKGPGKILYCPPPLDDAIRGENERLFHQKTEHFLLCPAYKMSFLFTSSKKHEPGSWINAPGLARKGNFTYSRAVRYSLNIYWTKHLSHVAWKPFQKWGEKENMTCFWEMWRTVVIE